MARLSDNREVNDDSIQLDRTTYRVYANSEDITNKLSRAEKKRLFPDFNEQLDNDRLSNERKARHGEAVGSIEPLPESTALEFVDNIVTDPFSAPIESLSNKANEFFGASGIIKLLLFAALIFAAYVFVAGGWFRRLR